ncbi:hypothetical protein DL93DRAFT_2030939, partial [Clavulina sp. PMI_390]
LVLVGARLGLDSITPVYHEPVKKTLTYPQSVGIAGGRPSSSYYFIGYQGDHLFYLDPHHTRPAIPLQPLREPSRPGTDSEDHNTHSSTNDLRTFHCDRVRKVHVSSIDPSMLFAFLCRDEAEW